MLLTIIKIWICSNNKYGWLQIIRLKAGQLFIIQINTFPANDYYYQYAKGIKTGTLDESGRNLIMASKDGNNYLLVTMGAPMYDKDGNAIYPLYRP